MVAKIPAPTIVACGNIVSFNPKRMVGASLRPCPGWQKVAALWRIHLDRVTKGKQTVLVALCMVSGLAALAGMSSVFGALVFGAGLTGLLAATGFGVLALLSGAWATVIALAPRPALQRSV